MASVGLCLIAKNWTPELDRALASIEQYVDKVYVQLNGKGPHPGMPAKLSNWQYFEWNNNFSDARNALLSEVKTDYWLWMDSDDEIICPENIRGVVAHMEATGVEMTFAPYEYATDDKGIVTELQLRERIIKTSLKGKWHGVIHETFIPETSPVRETTDLVTWKHINPDVKGSMIRNRKILEAEYSQEPRDPRIAYYLGLNYGMDGHYQEAIRCFEELINTGGWDEERYRSYLQIFSCLFELGEYEVATHAALQATTELPDWPDAYYLLQQMYYQLDDHEKSLAWFKVARSKPEPKTDSARNPVVTQYQPLQLAAYSYMALGEPKQAMRWAQELLRLQPSWDLGKLKDIILQAVNEAGAVDAVKYLADYLDQEQGRAVLEALPSELRADVRLTSERRRLIPGKTWPKGSVVFYCGQSYETWGPDTLAKGMGGSEEAVVYLARELAKDNPVTVYNERTTAYREAGGKFRLASYLPWTEINPNDTFDTFIAWRDPSGLKEINARLKLCDLHDIISQEAVYAAIPYTDIFCFKSNFHRELYPEVPDDKCVVIGNGILRSQFK